MPSTPFWYHFDKIAKFTVIRHVFGFWIEFLENMDIGIFGHFILIDFIKRYIATIRIFHLFQLPVFVDLELSVLSVMVNYAYLWIIPYFQHCFLQNFVFYSRKAYLAHQYKNMMYNPYPYRINIDENPIPLQRICVLSYLCLLLTKVLFETSFKSFQYNTEGRRVSNYSIKLILCSHYRSRCKGLCQNKKHELDQYTKGGHFCAAHMALNIILMLINWQ